MDNAEHCSVRADAQRQRQDRNASQYGLFPQPAQGEPNLRKERFQWPFHKVSE
jgi:hypothetical protein